MVTVVKWTFLQYKSICKLHYLIVTMYFGYTGVGQCEFSKINVLGVRGFGLLYILKSGETFYQKLTIKQSLMSFWFQIRSRIARGNRLTVSLLHVPQNVTENSMEIMKYAADSGYEIVIVVSEDNKTSHTIHRYISATSDNWRWYFWLTDWFSCICRVWCCKGFFRTR